jgi:hypothetical protein
MRLVAPAVHTHTAEPPQEVGWVDYTAVVIDDRILYLYLKQGVAKVVAGRKPARAAVFVATLVEQAFELAAQASVHIVAKDAVIYVPAEPVAVY